MADPPDILVEARYADWRERYILVEARYADLLVEARYADWRERREMTV